MIETREISGFILTRHWQDRRSGIELVLWLSTQYGPVKVLLDKQESIFFIAQIDVSKAQQLLAREIGWRCSDLELKDFSGNSISGFYFSNQKTFYRARDQFAANDITVYEADIEPSNRFLMERFAKGSVLLRGVIKKAGGYLRMENPALVGEEYSPRLKVVSVDIETAINQIELFSIGIYAVANGKATELVLMVGQSDIQLPEYLHFYPDEKSLLTEFLNWLNEYDPDIIIGWNIINFDMRYLQRIADKYRIPFTLGRESGEITWRSQDDESNRYQLQTTGRVVLDGIQLLREATYRFESFSLENVSRELLKEGKLLHDDDRGQAIGRLFETNKVALAQYNLRDCQLVWDIFEHTSLIDFAVARSHMTGLAVDRMGGSVASFDNLYLPQLHREGFVGPNASKQLTTSPGGFVMNSQPGIYNNVLVLDFKSLYPSIIRTFTIDPMGLALAKIGEVAGADVVPGYLDAEFARNRHILPAIIAQLWSRRDEAKASGDVAMSQAIKVIMNSFYGVLGTPACRFFDARLASSITRRGHEILQKTRDFIEQRGYPVVYGDTDSVFVWAKDSEDEVDARRVGQELSQSLNNWWNEYLQTEYNVESILEIEFETLYTKFLMPTVRGSNHLGSKKRYAGVVNTGQGPSVVFKGLENVRTDWTAIAREFQMELYRRIFFEQPYKEYIVETVRVVAAGECDEKLVYRKRLRKKLEDYVRNIPPHAQAARLGKERGVSEPRRGDWIEYVITLQGAEPAGLAQASLDYQHYIDNQLAPVADGILHFLNESFTQLTGDQIDLF